MTGCMLNRQDSRMKMQGCHDGCHRGAARFQGGVTSLSEKVESLEESIEALEMLDADRGRSERLTIQGIFD